MAGGGSWGDYSVGQNIPQKRTESASYFYSALQCFPCDHIAVFAVAVAHLERSNHLFSKRNEWQEMIKNPAKENVISRTEQRTVIGFLHGESVLTRYENRIVYISDDALPQKEMFPMAEKVTVYRKLAPNWYYLQVEY